jgi:hypothetical protein
MEGFQEKKNINNLRELVYQVNGKNAYVLAKEFDFDEYEEEFIQRTFWPIITLNEIDVDSIIAKTIDFKEEFINYYKEFDIDIFKREHLDYFEYEIKEFQSAVKKGKYNVLDTKKGKHFYHLKLESEKDTPRHQTLLITEKDEIQLELYFKKIIGFVESFIENQTIFNPKNTTQKTEESKKSKRLITDVQLKNKDSNKSEKEADKLGEQITHINKIEIAKEIIIKYDSFKGYRLRILLEALRELDLFPKGNTDSVFHRCCINDFKDAGTYQSMEKGTFKRKYKTPNGKAVITDHEKIFDSIIIFLKSITNK